MAGGVRGPGNAVDGGSVVAQSGHWQTGNTHVQYDHLCRVEPKLHIPVLQLSMLHSDATIMAHSDATYSYMVYTVHVYTL